MHRATNAVTALPLALAAAACVPQAAPEATRIEHPNVIIVRDFAVPAGVVSLDPSFGFSLYRGTPGVPAGQRAASVGRAAAFELADTVTQRLRAAGLDAIHGDTAAPEPGARALIVTGAFVRIDEGQRRHGREADVYAEAEIDYAAPGSTPQHLARLPLDSRRLPDAGAMATASRQGHDSNAGAARIGAAVARYVIELARRNRWPGYPGDLGLIHPAT